MPTRTSTAVWTGSLGSGSGEMTIGDGVWTGPYSVPSRFEEGDGTNPEELIGAAHAGCFSMALSGVLARAGHDPESIETTADVTVEKFDDGWRITTIVLQTTASVPGMDDAAFQESAEDAKANCPVSKALAGVEIRLEASLAN
ncbi:MAG: OsmC family protein [Actinobacteria bacterium]|nr:OsmC family protein [Actinomycetota bacterium]